MRDTVQKRLRKLFLSKNENRIRDTAEAPFKRKMDIKMSEWTSAICTEFRIGGDKIHLLLFHFYPLSMMPHFRAGIEVVIETPEGKFELKIPFGNSEACPCVNLQRQEEGIFFLKHKHSPFRCWKII
ncbi:hypothetical protein SDC9_192376 [bioreactor metagenome]|uniref:Uncharacterized protein n=1 Tax=bioreactor metagenome TaxID=1076179 RepID=A0A645I304_9ZZZZ